MICLRSAQRSWMLLSNSLSMILFWFAGSVGGEMIRTEEKKDLRCRRTYFVCTVTMPTAQLPHYVTFYDIENCSVRQRSPHKTEHEFSLSGLEMFILLHTV